MSVKECMGSWIFRELSRIFGELPIGASQNADKFV